MPLRIALLTAAIAALFAAPAQADIALSNVKTTPTNAKAGQKTDFTLSFDLTGSESIKDLDLNLPAGLTGNPNSPAKRTEDQIKADACPADSQVGTQTVNVTVVVLPVDVNGRIYNLTPHAGEPARLGIILDSPTGKIFLESPVTVRPEDGGLTSTLRGIPDQGHINSISLTLRGEVGAAKKTFMNNPTSCNPAVTKLHVVGQTGGTADGQASFTPTN